MARKVFRSTPPRPFTSEGITIVMRLRKEWEWFKKERERGQAFWQAFKEFRHPKLKTRSISSVQSVSRSQAQQQTENNYSGRGRVQINSICVCVWVWVHQRQHHYQFIPGIKQKLIRKGVGSKRERVKHISYRYVKKKRNNKTSKVKTEKKKKWQG